MSRNEPIAPIDHGFFSAAANVTAGTIGGALKGGISTALLWTGAIAVVGAVTGGLLVGGALPVILGGLLGTGIGAGSSWLPGGIATFIGGFKGGARASDRVDAERMAAEQVRSEIRMVELQRAAMHSQGAPADKYEFPAQGSAMNPAASSVLPSKDAAYANEPAGRQVAGTIAQQQLQHAM